LGIVLTVRYGGRVADLLPRIRSKLDRELQSRLPQDGPTAGWELPPGFQVALHASGFDYPDRIAFLPRPGPEPDALLYYVSELPGAISVVTRSGEAIRVASDLLNFEWKEGLEAGLMGLEIDPARPRLYITLVYWDADAGVYRNRIDVLGLAADGRSIESRATLLDLGSEPTTASYCIQFVKLGPDGLLYVGVGKGPNVASAQDLTRFSGKILRLSPEGEAVASNPFFDPEAPDSPRSYVYALGFRNPFDLEFVPGAEAALVSDVGPGVDRILRLEAGRNYCFGRLDGDESMRCNALFTWGPGGGYAPTGVAISQRPPLALDGEASAFVGIFGSVHVPGPNQGKRIERFALDDSGHLRSGPSQIVRYQGAFFSTVTDIGIFEDELYFADIYGPTDEPHRGQGRVYRVSFDAGAAAAAVDPDRSATLSPIERGAELFRSAGCFACHPSDADAPPLEGPALDRTLASRLDRRLEDDAYEATLRDLGSRDGAFFSERRELYERLLALAGRERTRLWIVEHIREPRFDNPESKMPSFPQLSDAELDALAAFLLSAR